MRSHPNNGRRGGGRRIERDDHVHLGGGIPAGHNTKLAKPSRAIKSTPETIQRTAHGRVSSDRRCPVNAQIL